MSDQLAPFALTMTLTTAQPDVAAAGEVLDELIARLPEGVFMESGTVDTMRPVDVLAGSPLSDALQA